MKLLFCPYLHKYDGTEATESDVVPPPGHLWCPCYTLKAIYKVKDHLKLQDNHHQRTENRKRTQRKKRQKPTELIGAAWGQLTTRRTRLSQ